MGWTEGYRAGSPRKERAPRTRPQPPWPKLSLLSKLPSAPLWWCLLPFPLSTPATLWSFCPLFWFFQGSCWFLSLRNNSLSLFTILWRFFLLKPYSLQFHLAKTELQGHIFHRLLLFIVAHHPKVRAVGLLISPSERQFMTILMQDKCERHIPVCCLIQPHWVCDEYEVPLSLHSWLWVYAGRGINMVKGNIPLLSPPFQTATT